MSHSFAKQQRLRSRREFVAVQSRGRRIHGRHFVILVLAGGSGRVGITVSKKVGNAVTRNRVKRLVREFVRRHPGWVPAHADMVIVSRQSAATRTQAEVDADLGALQGRLVAC